MSVSQAKHLSAVVREVEDFVSTAGWDQPPQLFALVPTAELVQAQPELAITTGNLVTAADFAGQACQGASHDDPSMRVSAQTAAAAVAVLGSGSEVDIERFAALVRERNGTVAGRFAALTVGAVGSTLDEPDVAAMCRTLGFANLSAPDRA